MGMGVATVSTDVGAVPEYGHHNYNMLISEKRPEKLAEAVRHLLDNPKERARIAGNAARSAAEWSWDRTVRRYLEVVHHESGCHSRA